MTYLKGRGLREIIGLERDGKYGSIFCMCEWGNDG